MTPGFVCGRRFARRVLPVGALMAVSALSALGQNQAAANGAAGTGAAAGAIAYDVASVKPYKPGGEMMFAMARFNPDGFTAQGMSLKSLMCSAYDVQWFQISGGPGWFESDQFSVQAKMDEASTEALAKLSPKQAFQIQQSMLQALLADRFQLTLHRTTKEMPLYTLVIAKGGPKLHEAAPGDTYPNGLKGFDGHSGAGMMWFGPDGKMTAQGIPMEQLAQTLKWIVGGPVEDKTGLKGKYDFMLDFAFRGLQAAAPNDAAGSAAPAPESKPSIFAALQEQLGLKLESTKGPVEILVVDHAEKPSAD